MKRNLINSQLYSNKRFKGSIFPSTTDRCVDSISQFFQNVHLKLKFNQFNNLIFFFFLKNKNIRRNLRKINDYILGPSIKTNNNSSTLNCIKIYLARKDNQFFRLKTLVIENPGK
jgi:hypothetical protein